MVTAAIALMLVGVALAGCRSGDGPPPPNYFAGQMRNHAMIGSKSGMQVQRQ
jgi:hypothetical protein